MKTIKLNLVGLTPLMQHNEQLANPHNPFVKAMKAIPRKKSEDDLEQLRKLEFMGGLYYDEKLGPFVPVDWVLATTKEGARRTKQGKLVESGLYEIPGKSRFPLKYKGPRLAEELYSDDRFVDYRGVGVQQARVMRCRPIFPEWSIKAELSHDEKLLSESDLLRFLETAGSYIGMGDYRPRFGRFMVELA